MAVGFEIFKSDNGSIDAILSIGTSVVSESVVSLAVTKIVYLGNLRFTTLQDNIHDDAGARMCPCTRCVFANG